MATPPPFHRAPNPHGTWLPHPSHPTTFPHFPLLPLEIRLLIFHYASPPAQNQTISASTQPFPNEPLAFSRTAYFFPGQIRLSPAFLRGLDTVRRNQEGGGGLYRAWWRRLGRSWAWDDGRALAGTCRGSREVVLGEWIALVRGIAEDGGERGGGDVGDVKWELVEEMERVLGELSAGEMVDGNGNGEEPRD